MIVIPFENCSTNQTDSPKYQRSLAPSHSTQLKLLLTDILPRTIKPIEVIQITQRPKEIPRSAHPIPNDDPALRRALDLEVLDDGAGACLDFGEDVRVDGECVGRGALEECFVGDYESDMLALMEIRQGRNATHHSGYQSSPSPHSHQASQQAWGHHSAESEEAGSPTRIWIRSSI